MEMLSIDQILAQYPEQWVLIGDYEVFDPNRSGIKRHLISRAVVLGASKDKRELIPLANEIRKIREVKTWFFTGNMPQGTRYLL